MHKLDPVWMAVNVTKFLRLLQCQNSSRYVFQIWLITQILNHDAKIVLHLLWKIHLNRGCSKRSEGAERVISLRVHNFTGTVYYTSRLSTHTRQVTRGVVLITYHKMWARKTQRYIKLYTLATPEVGGQIPINEYLHKKEWHLQKELFCIRWVQYLEYKLSKNSREHCNCAHNNRKWGIRLDKRSKAHELSEEKHPHTNFYHVVRWVSIWIREERRDIKWCDEMLNS